MMKKIDTSEIINASDIGQYQYCSIAWYLKKQGFKPESISLKQGILKHKKLGAIIDRTEKNIKKVHFFEIIGLLLFIISILIFVFGVII